MRGIDDLTAKVVKGGLNRRDFNSNSFVLEVTNKFYKIRISRHDNNGVDLIGQLSGLNGKRDVGTFVARTN